MNDIIFMQNLSVFICFYTKNALSLQKIRIFIQKMAFKEENRIIEGQTELAKRLGVTQQTVSRWQREGRFKGCCIRIGKKCSYDLDAILQKFGG